MKQLILAAVAATLVFASAAQAATAAKAEQTTTTTTTITGPLDADACKKGMEACGADQACKDTFAKEHAECKAE